MNWISDRNTIWKCLLGYVTNEHYQLLEIGKYTVTGKWGKLFSIIIIIIIIPTNYCTTIVAAPTTITTTHHPPPYNSTI